MKPVELVSEIKRSGGILTLDGDDIEYQLPSYSAHLVKFLREHKQEMIPLLQAHGGRIASPSPHCPSCTSYNLRLTRFGYYRCGTCGVRKIAREIAFRVN